MSTTTEQINFYEDVYESLPQTVTIIYLGIVVVSFLAVAIYAGWKLSKPEFDIDCTFGNWFGLILDLRKIYIHAVIHMADTVSDVAVIAQFWRLSDRERNDDNFNVEGLDMTGLFIGTLTALITYRMFTGYHLFYIAGGSILLFTLQFLDLGVYLCIYLAWKLNRIEPIFWQDYLTHVEALFESIPQILIQSQFVLRSGENNEIVVASIVISFISVVTRFVKSDHPFVKKDCRQLLLEDENKKLRKPYFSLGFVLLYILRTCEITVRLVCAVFMWAVLGFVPLFVCFVVTLLISQRFLWKTKSQRFLFWYIAVPIECIVPAKRKHIWTRTIENWLYLSIISLYSYYTDAWCLTCSDIEYRNAQIDPDKIVWSLGYVYFFLGWICSILLPVLWYIVWVAKLYIPRVKTQEETREEIMEIPLMFYRKRGCWKPTVTPLHFAVHRKFDKQVQKMLENKKVDINAIRISGATALHSAVTRALINEVRLLLRHGARKDIKKEEVWYFRCCMPWKWCGRNWYEGKTALEIAQYKVQEEEEEFKKNNKEMPAEHAYKQVLELLENPPPIDHGKGDKGRTDNNIGDDDGVELVTQQTDSKIVGNEEDNIGLDIIMDDDGGAGQQDLDGDVEE